MAEDTYHVTPKDDGWQVKKERAQRASGTFDTKPEAVERARELAKEREGQIKVHTKDGKIQEERTYRKDPFPPKG